jgi:hypothetical protein
MVAQFDESDSFHDSNDHRYGSIYANENGNDAKRNPLVPDDTAPCIAPFLKDQELLWDEIEGMAKLSVPVIITSVLEMLPSIVTIVLVGRVENEDESGHVGDVDGEGITTSMQQLHLDAAALAVMLVNVVCFAPANGEFE